MVTMLLRRIMSSSSLTLFFDYGILLMVGVVTFAFLYYHRRRTLPRPRASVDPPGRVTNTNTGNRHNNNNKSSLDNPVATTRNPVAALRTITTIPPPRVPVHVSPHVRRTNGQQQHNNNNNVLVQQSDGCVAFVYTKAAAASTPPSDGIDPNITLLFRRLSSNTTTTTTASPPKRGSTVIVAIPVDDVDCPQLVPDVLMRLGMYYNTFVMLVLPASDVDTTTAARQQQRLDAIATLRRNGGLSPEVIPTHRILASTTVEGRIAFIRQQVSPTATTTTASRSSSTNTATRPTTTTWPYWIVDFDPHVSTILARFGYEAVMIYNNKNHHHPDETVGSGLGRMIQQ